MSKEQEKGQLIRLGGLWLNQGRNGQKYMAGSFGQARILVLKNDRKRGDSDPDYVMMLAPGQKKDGKGRKDEASDDIAY
jgi:hypothetical protein